MCDLILFFLLPNEMKSHSVAELNALVGQNSKKKNLKDVESLESTPSVDKGIKQERM